MIAASEYYHFNIVTRAGILLDEEGTLLPSLESARIEALTDARAMMSDAIRKGIDVSGRSIEICNGSGGVLLVVRFLEAIIGQA